MQWHSNTSNAALFVVGAGLSVCGLLGFFFVQIASLGNDNDFFHYKLRP
jgi:predicted membrane channel-forming protein YqfA (hemolysin III family)